MSQFRNSMIQIVIFLGAAGVIFGQQQLLQPAGKWWKNPQVVEKLQLTPDQQARIESLWTENRQSLVGKQAELKAQNQSLSQVLAQNPVNVDAAIKAHENVLAARADVERSTFLLRLRIKSVLNPDQQQKLENIAGRLRQRIQSRIGARTGIAGSAQ
jgi:Spy/CpxP family protein refolding chaperone